MNNLIKFEREVIVSSSIFLNIVPGRPGLSLFCVFFILATLLYFARTPAHQSIRSFFRVMKNFMRLSACSVLRAEKRLAGRNQEVLKAEGLENINRELDREFHRVGLVVERDLQGYPVLNRKLSEQIEKIDQDYSDSNEVPPTPPVWINAVDAIAKLSKESGEGMVKEILTDIHKTIERQQKGAMVEYWKSTNKRHKIMSRMMPYWRKVTKILSEVGSTMDGLQDRALVIDKKMQEYEDIKNNSNGALIKLHSASSTQFFIDTFWMMVAIGGIFVNFHLIALPMSEMVGGNSRIGGVLVNQIAALVFILFEVFAGMALMESLRITRLFPIIGQMDDKKRNVVAYIALSIILLFAMGESALAYMRDIIAANNEALKQSLFIGEDQEILQVARSIIPTIVQMGLGFLLPIILVFAVIPMESFVHSLRTVLGYLIEFILRAFAVILRILGNIFYYMGSVIISIYDLIIFFPLWVEDLIKGYRADKQTQPPSIITEKEEPSRPQTHEIKDEKNNDEEEKDTTIKEKTKAKKTPKKSTKKSS